MIRVAVGLRCASEVLLASNVGTSNASIFSSSELSYCNQVPRQTESLAARWAAKDGLMLLFSEILHRPACEASELSVDRVEMGGPRVRLSARLSHLLREEGVTSDQIEVSLTHTDGVALAIVAMTLAKNSEGLSRISEQPAEASHCPSPRDDDDWVEAAIWIPDRCPVS